MTRNGLIIGSFDPIHLGHINMIKYGAKKCNKLNVLVCDSAPTDTIDGQLRYKWVKEIFKDYENVKVELLTKQMPDSKESNMDVSKVWAVLLKEMFPDVNYIIASEMYGKYLAELMSTEKNKVNYDIYDIQRIKTSISSTAIRENPFDNWNYIPDVVKPHFVKKICIYGPESCGKSTMTKNLALHFNTNYVEEVARTIIDKKNIKLDELTIENLEEFAKAQYLEVKNNIKFANKYLFCDTDNITTQIYSDVYLGKVSDNIKKYDEINYDLYLLLDVDVKWVEDTQRNLGNRRKEMFERFKAELDKRNLNYEIISGNWYQRLEESIEIIKNRYELKDARKEITENLKVF